MLQDIYQLGFLICFIFLIKMGLDDYRHRKIKKSDLYIYISIFLLTTTLFVLFNGVSINPYHFFIYMLMVGIYTFLWKRYEFHSADMLLFLVTSLYFIMSNKFFQYILGITIGLIYFYIRNRNKVDDSTPYAVVIAFGYLLGF